MLSAGEKRSYIEYLQSRYRRAKKKQKGMILDELCERLLVSRKHGVRLMRTSQVGRPRNPLKRGRPSKYQDYEFIQALRLMWKSTRYMCSRALKEAIPDWLPYLESERGAFREDIRERLLQISPPTIDRILKPYKAKKGISFTRSTGFRDEIPIQENIWNIQIPGFMESDTVAHCGGSMHGEFINTLTMVDIATLWTEARVSFGRGSNPVFEQLQNIESGLPFPIKGYDADNGGEVLNGHILSYFRDERIEQGRPPVQVTRSRAYKKNDNAHVEQRNDSIARRYLGYERLDSKQLAPLLNYYYSEIVCPLQNHFFPTFKLKGKLRIKSRTRRVYDKPITPYQRVMESPYVDDEYKEQLCCWHQKLNPVQLVRDEASMRKLIDTLQKKSRSGSSFTLPHTPAPKRPTLFKRNGVPILRISQELHHYHQEDPHNFR